MLTLPLADIDRRARAVASALAGSGITSRILDGSSTTGGGSAPESQLPTRRLAVRVPGRSAADAERQLRLGDPPIVARIDQDEVLLDLRTVSEDDDARLAEAIRDLAGRR